MYHSNVDTLNEINYNPIADKQQESKMRNNNFVDVAFDAETIRSQDQDFINDLKYKAAGVKVDPGSKTKDDLISDILKLQDNPLEAAQLKGMKVDGLKEIWINGYKDIFVANEFEKLHAKTSFSAADGGEIVSMACKVINSGQKTIIKYRAMNSDVSEFEILKQFFDYFDKLQDWASSEGGKVVRFVGANIYGFDFKFLAQRAMILGVPFPKFALMSSEYDTIRYFDVLRAFNLGDRKSELVSLSRLCRILGVESPKVDDQGEIHGGMVWDIWSTGGEEGAARIAAYNGRDVDVLEPIFNKVRQVMGRQ
ncbi:putative DnaQ-like exonuclease [Serratia phage vB_SmaS_PhooPhighters]|uniref:Putative dnaQ-like exonuclease n=1 Tax=Serratia phage vB_SmaS_Rovert TaxID=2777363 RepID=A0A7T3N9R2_9CAUD|nr:putative dnaQ-like exonuclease [Serratia phage vB_SmaS_Rovert]QPX74997.1 putative dnaQ-like exonuclease [Serratia phage vB_SmaS_Rovert]UGO51970.1 putative DnaQ-like exonuclease [Serratia phage vB_SmaS_PhooPhighters]